MLSEFACLIQVVEISFDACLVLYQVPIVVSLIYMSQNQLL
jgi:hypothetical protein